MESLWKTWLSAALAELASVQTCRSWRLMASRVGGVVSETSFKFFTQFVGWTAIYCIFNLVVAAYFLAEYKRKVREFYQFFSGVRTRL